jgi:hypothetical protein
VAYITISKIISVWQEMEALPVPPSAAGAGAGAFLSMHAHVRALYVRAMHLKDNHGYTDDDVLPIARFGSA